MLIFMYSVRVADKRGRKSRKGLDSFKVAKQKIGRAGREPMNNRNQSSGGEGERFKGVIVIIRGVAYSSGNKAAQLLCTHRSRALAFFSGSCIERGKAGEPARTIHLQPRKAERKSSNATRVAILCPRRMPRPVILTFVGPIVAYASRVTARSTRPNKQKGEKKRNELLRGRCFEWFLVLSSGH